MLLRRSGAGTLVFTQPGHSWLSGQFARAWGNAAFDAPQAGEAFAFAAALHDIGWVDHDRQPIRDAETGLPRTFWDVPATEHTALWRTGVERLLAFGAYPALLVSLHARTIYDLTFDPRTASPENRAAVERFCAEQEAFRAGLEARLAGDPATAALVTVGALERARLLLLAVDQLSLNACWGVTGPVDVPDVPAKGGDTRHLVMRPGPEAETIIVDPWPFRTASVDGIVEARRLDGPCPDPHALAAALEAAPRKHLVIRLQPG